MPDVFCVIKEPWALAEAIGMLALDAETWVTCVFQSNATAVFHVEGKDRNTTITAMVSADMFDHYSLSEESTSRCGGVMEDEIEEDDEKRRKRRWAGRSLPVGSKRVAPAQFQVHLQTFYRALLYSNIFSRASPTRMTLSYTSAEELVTVSILIEDEEEEEEEEEVDQDEEEESGLTLGHKQDKRIHSRFPEKRRHVEVEKEAHDPFEEYHSACNVRLATRKEEGGRGGHGADGVNPPHRPSRELQSILQTCPMPSTLLNLRFDDALLEGEALLDGRVFHDTIADFAQAGCKEVMIECFPFASCASSSSHATSSTTSTSSKGERPSSGLSFLGDLRLSGKSMDMEVLEVLRGEKEEEIEEDMGREEKSEDIASQNFAPYRVNAERVKSKDEREWHPQRGEGEGNRELGRAGDNNEDKGSIYSAAPPISLGPRSVKTTLSTFHLALTAGSGSYGSSTMAFNSFSNRVHVRVNSIGQVNVMYTKYHKEENDAQAVVTVSFVVMPKVTFDDW